MDINSKRKESEEIERLTQEYLERGGKITQCQEVRFVSASKRNLAKNGIDYMPWKLMGDPIDCFIALKDLGDGNYLTPKRKMSDE